MRVVSLVPSATETLRAWGVDPVACTRFCEQPDLPTVGGTKNPDVAGDRRPRSRPGGGRRGGEPARGSRRPRHGGARGARPGDPLARRPRRAAPRARRPGGRIVDATGPGRASRPAAPGVRADLAATLDGARPGHLRRVAARRRGHRAWCPPAWTAIPRSSCRRSAARSTWCSCPTSRTGSADAHLAELSTVAPAVRVDGKDLFWWGERTRGALDRLRDLDGIRALGDPSSAPEVVAPALGVRRTERLATPPAASSWWRPTVNTASSTSAGTSIVVERSSPRNASAFPAASVTALAGVVRNGRVIVGDGAEVVEPSASQTCAHTVPGRGEAQVVALGAGPRGAPTAGWRRPRPVGAGHSASQSSRRSWASGIWASSPGTHVEQQVAALGGDVGQRPTSSSGRGSATRPRPGCSRRTGRCPARTPRPAADVGERRVLGGADSKCGAGRHQPASLRGCGRWPGPLAAVPTRGARPGAAASTGR